MNPHSPSAYFTSAVLHLAVAVLLVLVAFFAKKKTEEPFFTVEMVMGEGTNYLATQAPAAGIERPLFTPAPAPPPAPEPVAEPAPAVPESSPLQAVPEPRPTAAPKAEKKQPTLAEQVRRTADRREATVMRKFEKEQKAKARKEAEAAEKARKEAAKRMTKEQFDAANKNPRTVASTSKSTAAKAIKVPSVAEGIKGGIAGGSTANKTGGASGKVRERQEADEMRAYISAILARIRDTMSKAGFTDALSVKVQFTIAASGTLSDAGVLQSSGSNEFDRAVIDAFRTIPSFGPPPNRQAGTYAVVLEMRDEN